MKCPFFIPAGNIIVIFLKFAIQLGIDKIGAYSYISRIFDSLVSGIEYISSRLVVHGERKKLFYKKFHALKRCPFLLLKLFFYSCNTDRLLTIS
jgi:hypothetical protein